MVMESGGTDASLDVFPYIKVLKDGTIVRTAGTGVLPPGLDPETSVLSKDVTISPETGVSVRLYRPASCSTARDRKVPLVVYFHGGAFCISSVADPVYHDTLNKLVAEAEVVAVSVNYRLAPEAPLPAAYEDCWDSIMWVGSHIAGSGSEPWLVDHVDFGKIFLAGDSAGANIAHHLALRMNESSEPAPRFQTSGIVMIHPYFWGAEPIGTEVKDKFRKEMVDGWWKFVCPSDKGCDDAWINPFAEGSPGLEGLKSRRLLVLVAEKDILRDRGRVYYEKLVQSEWGGEAELWETKGKDHVFHMFEPDCPEAKELIKSLGAFINK